MKLVVAIAIAAGAVALTATSSTAGASPGGSHQLRGLIRHTPRPAHASRWLPARRTTKGAGFNCVSSCASYEATINQFFTDVAADSGSAAANVYSVATQYGTIANTETFDAATNTYVDGSPFPTTKTCQDGFDTYCVTDKQLQTEIAKVIAARGWPTQTTTDLYFVFTPANVGVCLYGRTASNTNPCTTNYFCAYHRATSSFIYAVEPDAAAVAGDACSTGAYPAGNAADDTLSTVSHEQAEAVTDPFDTAWTSDDPETYKGVPGYFAGSEIGDLCAYNYGAPLGTATNGQSYNQLINGHDYFLQQEYSNADGGCVQQLGGTATNFDSSNPLYSGVGPLVDHGGDVMTTNTVYAIYWVPAKPANISPPTISGIAKVGKKLTASRGRWSYAPTFTYRWLRCSAAGTSCKGITKATRPTYTLAKADLHHRIEVRVTATNAAGHAAAISTPTRKVRS